MICSFVIIRGYASVSTYNNRTTGDEGMRKLLTILCLLGVVVLTACGTNSGNSKAESEPSAQGNKQSKEPSSEQSNKPSSSQDEEQKVIEQNFGEPFYYETTTMNKGTSQVMITLTDPEIVNERHDEDRT